MNSHVAEILFTDSTSNVSNGEKNFPGESAVKDLWYLL